VFTNAAGPVAVAPDGVRVAVAEPLGIRFATPGELTR
jgi:hypothetical protein